MPMAIGPRPNSLPGRSWRKSGSASTNWRAWRRPCRKCTRNAPVTGRYRAARLSKRWLASHHIRNRRPRPQRHDSMVTTAEQALKDPVCGMTVASDSEHYSTYQGQTWYFCSDRCRARFDTDPQAVLNGAHKDNTRTTSGGSSNIYTCPMHPEVRQDGPGDCPDCGMALEPETPQTSRVEYTCPMH